MPIYGAAALERGIASMFAACGVPADEARIVADHLVDAEACGVASHGLLRVPQYVTAVAEGQVKLGAELRIMHETASTAKLDGQSGFGQVMATRAMVVAIGIARRSGVAAVTLVNCGHTGRLASYTQQAARKQIIGLMMVNSGGCGQWVAPYGGTAGRLATSPLSIAVPRAGGAPLVLDMATSAAAEGKIRALWTAGRPIPPGWMIDPAGNETTRPEDLYGPPRGAILPFGQHKGFGLAMMVDLLAGALSGAGSCTDADAPMAGPTDGVFMVAIDPGAFCPAEQFAAIVDAAARHVKSSPPAPGFEEVLVPGEIEVRRRAHGLDRGIPVADATWRTIVETAEKLGQTSEALFGQE